MTQSPLRDRPIWGLASIAKVLGVSEATARRLAKQPGVPIYRPAGQGAYVAFTGEMKAWLMGQQR